jgi:hypothetical protein
MGWQCRSNYRKHEALTSIPITATEEREEGRKEGWREDGQFLLPILTSLSHFVCAGHISFHSVQLHTDLRVNLKDDYSSLTSDLK